MLKTILTIVLMGCAVACGKKDDSKPVVERSKIRQGVLTPKAVMTEDTLWVSDPVGSEETGGYQIALALSQDGSFELLWTIALKPKDGTKKTETSGRMSGKWKAGEKEISFSDEKELSEEYTGLALSGLFKDEVLLEIVFGQKGVPQVGSTVFPLDGKKLVLKQKPIEKTPAASK